MSRLVVLAVITVAAGSWACDSTDDRAHEESPGRSTRADAGEMDPGLPFDDTVTDPQDGLVLRDLRELDAPGWSNALHARACATAGSDGPPRAEGRFVDVTDHAGLNGPEADPCDAEPLQCVAASMTGGAAAGDFDADGYVDLYVARNRARDSLYLNCRNGTFADVSEQVGINKADQPSNGAVWADVDADGDLDLFVTVLGASANRHYLYLSEGGTFREDGVNRGVAMWNEGPLYGTGAAFGDYDADGYLDLYVGEWRHASLVPADAPQRNHARLLRNLGPERPGFFEDVTDRAGVAVGGETGNGVVRQRGVFVFTPMFADLDDDGALDLALASDFGSSRLFWNSKDGRFADGTAEAKVGTDQAGMGSSIADYDGDGRLDWFVTSIYESKRRYDGNRLYRNAGKRRFDDATDAVGVRDIGWGWGDAVLDYDNDSDQDLLAVAGFTDREALLKEYAGRLSLWQNPGRGDREYEDVAPEIAPPPNGQGRGVAVFDLENDGDQDVFIVYHGARDALLRNDVAGPAQHYLRVQLRGAVNRAGIGGRVTIVSNGVRQMRELHSGSGYLGQHENVAHFGLGASGGSVDMQVRMPDGVTQTFRELTADRTV